MENDNKSRVVSGPRFELAISGIFFISFLHLLVFIHFSFLSLSVLFCFFPSFPVLCCLCFSACLTDNGEHLCHKVTDLAAKPWRNSRDS